LELSSSAVAAAIRAAELADGPPTSPATPPTSLRFDSVLDEGTPARARPPRPVRIRSDLKISRQTRERFRDLIRATAVAPADSLHDSAWHRMLDWLRPGARSRAGSSAAKRRRAAATSAAEALGEQLPDGIELRRYVD